MIKSLKEIDYETDREDGIDTIFSRQENNKLKGDDVLNGERGDDKIMVINIIMSSRVEIIKIK